ncbi:nuclear transport factor 2 family protein [Streptomyces sp. NPDC101166]|uniref:nuclear transport factor 2 family protein n=1 Tax=Streptomyces sp. NPDC101166 TaxID=3366120 RepID=UPI0037F3FF4F
MASTASQIDSAIYVERMRSMCAAVKAHDIDTVLSYFDDACVFINGVTGTTSEKSELVEFLNETWSVFPDYAPQPVATYMQGDTLGVLFEITATAPQAEGQAAPEQIRWLATSFTTFDPVSLRIVRDAYYVDEDAIQRQIIAAQRTGNH